VVDLISAELYSGKITNSKANEYWELWHPNELKTSEGNLSRVSPIGNANTGIGIGNFCRTGHWQKNVHDGKELIYGNEGDKARIKNIIMGS
jgi:hypothetical protein